MKQSLDTDGTFCIPTVTEADLEAFHAKHFVGEAEDDDGLGWYADGIKRRLTDEQIRIFRHSEIQRCTRNRELGIKEPSEEPSAQTVLPADSKRRKKKQSRTKRPDVPQDIKQRTLETNTNHEKRKWANYIETDHHANPGQFTHRRIARELDEQKEEPTQLLYDD